MADVAPPNDAASRCRYNDAPNGNRQKRPTTREKIAKMVADGAVNYPSYLKLIYTGDSEQEPSSSEDELGVSFSRRVAAVPASDSKEGDTQPAVEHNQLPPRRNSPESHKLIDDGPEKQRTPTAPGVPDVVECPETVTVDCVAMTTEQQNELDQCAPNNAPMTWHEQDQSSDEHARLRQNLTKIMSEIATLKSVLNAKLNRAGFLRRIISVSSGGSTAKKDFRDSLRSLAQTQTFQRTQAAFKSFGAYASRTMDNLRQSDTFKSVGIKVGSLRTSQSMYNFRSKWSGMRASYSESNVSTVTPMAVGDDDDEISHFSSTPRHYPMMTSAINQFAI